MEDDMQKMLVTLLVVALITPTSAFAQTPPAQLSMAVLPAFPPPPPQQQHQQVTQERGWVGRHPVLFAALVGLGVGVGVEAAVIPGESGGEPHSAYLPMFGGVGAGIGALVGLIVSAARRK
jgi:anti-sigma factor RsiW